MVPKSRHRRRWTDEQLKRVYEYVEYTKIMSEANESEREERKDEIKAPDEFIDELIYVAIEEMKPFFYLVIQETAEKVLHVRKLKKQAQQSEASSYEI